MYNPQEEALQSLCKQLLKSRIFRGFYEERRYVENINSYRDIIRLQRTEKDFEKLLLDIRQKFEMFHQNKPNLWIGITNGAMFPIQNDNIRTLQTSIWAELDDIAFGQYWFIVRSIRFRDNEIMLKLKMMRPIEDEALSPKRSFFSPMHKDKTINTDVNAIKPSISNTSVTTTIPLASTAQSTESNQQPAATVASATNTSSIVDNYNDVVSQISLQDFIEILSQWGTTIKHTVYNFMYEDITKENILAVLKFIGLIVITLITASISALKFLGIFILRFMFEFSRLTNALSPIIFRIIDVINKMIGGFYILLTMIWKDVFINRGQPINQRNAKYIEYHTQIPNDHLRRQSSEFERQFQ